MEPQNTENVRMRRTKIAVLGNLVLERSNLVRNRTRGEDNFSFHEIKNTLLTGMSRGFMGPPGTGFNSDICDRVDGVCDIDSHENT